MDNEINTTPPETRVRTKSEIKQMLLKFVWGTICFTTKLFIFSFACYVAGLVAAMHVSGVVK